MNRRTALGAFTALLLPATALASPESGPICSACRRTSDSFALVDDGMLCDDCHVARQEAEIDATFCGRCGICKRAYLERDPDAGWHFGSAERCVPCERLDSAEWWASLRCGCGSKDVKRSHGPVAYCAACLQRPDVPQWLRGGVSDVPRSE